MIMPYRTKQREMIWGYLMENKNKHITADEILYYLKSKDTPVGKSTIYRYLDMLEKQGQVRKYAPVENESTCYQASADDGDCYLHHHLICNICGEFIHLECSHLDGLKRHIYDNHQFQVDLSKTVLYGICMNCNLKKGC